MGSNGREPSSCRLVPRCRRRAAGHALRGTRLAAHGGCGSWSCRRHEALPQLESVVVPHGTEPRQYLSHGRSQRRVVAPAVLEEAGQGGRAPRRDGQALQAGDKQEAGSVERSSPCSAKLHALGWLAGGRASSVCLSASAHPALHSHGVHDLHGRGHFLPSHTPREHLQPGPRREGDRGNGGSR